MTALSYYDKIRSHWTTGELSSTREKYEQLINYYCYWIRQSIHRLRSSRDRLAGDLSEEQFWTKPHSYGNSFGNLVLHITGNLNYYVGAQIAQTGYIRQRDLEFTQTHVGQKQEVLKKLDTAVDMVVASIRNQTHGDWEQTFNAVGADDVHDRFGIYLRCAVHFSPSHWADDLSRQGAHASELIPWLFFR